MSRHRVAVGLLGAAGLVLTASACQAAAAGSDVNSRPHAIASSSTTPKVKLASATPELPAHSSASPGKTIVEVMPAPNAASLSVGSSTPFTLYLGCRSPQFSLNGKIWTAESSVQPRDGYWAGTLRLNSSFSAIFRDPAGHVLKFAAGSASVCRR